VELWLVGIDLERMVMELHLAVVDMECMLEEQPLVVVEIEGMKLDMHWFEVLRKRQYLTVVGTQGKQCLVKLSRRSERGHRLSKRPTCLEYSPHGIVSPIDSILVVAKFGFGNLDFLMI
jgi:hypothetical protein